MSSKFLKSGVITTGGLSNIIYIHDMKTRVLDDGSVFARIHYLDVSTVNEYFSSNTEVLKCTNKSNRYSRMGIVDSFKTSDGVYEFLLTYPSQSTTLYNRWTQTSSPNKDVVTGFTAITTAWSAHNAGIRRTNSSTAALFNCDTGGTWYAPIGQYGAWSSSQKIPAANSASTDKTELWVRIDNIVNENKLKLNENFITSTDFIEI